MNTTAETLDLLHAAETKLAAIRRNLGEAVAEGDDSAAGPLRVELAAAERRVDELKLSLPVAQESDEVLAAQREAEAQREWRVAQNERRTEHLAACRDFDAALSALGKAYEKLQSTHRNVGGARQETTLMARRRELITRSAIHAANSQLAFDLGFGRTKQVRPLTEWAEQMITEFPNEEA